MAFRLRAQVWLVVAALLLLVVACGAKSHSSPVSDSTKGTAKTGITDHASDPSAAHEINWVRFGFDPARGGVNPEETLISSKTVSSLRLLWRTGLPGVADSSPILLHDLKFAHATRDVLCATTTNGAVVALDAASGEILWSHRPSGPQITTSSPVADAARGLVYSYGLDGAVHRYAAITGKEHKGDGWPAQITRMPQTEKGSSALNIADGRIYATTSGYVGDAPPYQGHVVAVDEATGAEEVFNSLCSDTQHLLSARECPSERSGIWARGGAWWIQRPEASSPPRATGPTTQVPAATTSETAY